MTGDRLDDHTQCERLGSKLYTVGSTSLGYNDININNKTHTFSCCYSLYSIVSQLFRFCVVLGIISKMLRGCVLVISKCHAMWGLGDQREHSTHAGVRYHA